MAGPRRSRGKDEFWPPPAKPGAPKGEEVLCEHLSADVVDAVVEVLENHVTPERKERLVRVLASRTREVVLVLEDIANEHNASAVLRSAEAFGFFEVHVIESEARFKISSNVSSGAHKWLDLRRYGSTESALDGLKARGYEIWVSDIHGDATGVDTIDVAKKVALVFGNEHRGLSEAALAAADGRFVVPMTGFVESLNISVAAAVTAYSLFYRRSLASLGNGLEPVDNRAVYSAWLARSVKSARAILDRHGLPIPVIGRDPIASGVLVDER